MKEAAVSVGFVVMLALYWLATWSNVEDSAAQLKRIAAALEKANDLYMKQNGINRFKDS